MLWIMNLSLILLLFGVPQTLRLTDDIIIVRDRYNVSMVYVPSATVWIGASLDEALEKCEELRGESCRAALTLTTPGGIDDFVTPLERVHLESFFIDQYEVTIQAYLDCVADNACNAQVVQYIDDFSPYASTDEPMRYISYLDAEAYCQWRGGFIPSEAEWEYAARGSERLAFSWGNQFNGEYLNFCDSSCQVSAMANVLWDDGFTTLAPVNAHPQDVSWSEAVGMTGNVSEWTSTTHLPVPDGSQMLQTTRVIKGGFFGSTSDQVLLWRRIWLTEDEIREGIGFRCAKRL